MTIMRNFLWAYLLLTLLVLPVAAQESPAAFRDSLPKRQESVLNYKLIPRYRPENRQFSSGPFSNSWLFVSGSYYRPYTDDYGSGPMMSLGFGKWLTKRPSDEEIRRASLRGQDPSSLMKHYHGFMLGGGAGYFHDNYSGEHVRDIFARASYLFDISSYVSGYNPDRTLSVVALAGLGVNYSRASGDSGNKAGLSAHLGVQLTSHILPRIDIVFEPLAEIQQDSRRLARMDLWRRYLPVFRGSVSLNYSLDSGYHAADPGLDWRIFLSGGAVLQNASNGLGLSESMGPSVMAGVGRSVSDNFLWRLSLSYSECAWGTIYSARGEEARDNIYIGLRLDALYNILPLLSDSVHYELAVVAGPEAGWMEKKDSGMGSDFYIGLGAGMRLMWKPVSSWGVYAEPRCTIVPYSTWSNVHGVALANYYDGLLSLSLGVEYKLPVK